MKHADIINNALQKMGIGDNDNDAAAKRSLEKELVKVVNLAALYNLPIPQPSPTISGQIDNARGSRTGLPLPWVIQIADMEKAREVNDGKKQYDPLDYYGRRNNGRGNWTGD